MGQTGDNRSNQETADTANLAKEVHWIQHATFWSQVGLGLIGIVALCIYHGRLTVMKGQIAIMKASSRPYVGISTIKADPTQNGAAIIATINNFGTRPAFDFSAHWTILINGSSIAETGTRQEPFTLFPGRPVGLSASIGNQHWPGIAQGQDTLVIRATIRYRLRDDGPTDSYCEKNEYNALAKMFSPGKCTSE